MPIIVVAPSRGRPARAQEMVESFLATVADPATRLLLVVDESDLTRGEYLPLAGPAVQVLTLWGDETGNLVRATNSAARRFAWADILGHVGDDHVFRSIGWDVAVQNALRESGIAYGDDLLQGENLPTAPFISTEITRALGWYALPACRHMFIDDAWKALGQGLGALHYLPDVVIEHMHPGAGKAELDEGYLRADAETDTDRAAFNRWVARDLDGDVARVRASLAVAA